MGYEKPLTGAERAARHRAALRAQGLKPRTFWLPDTSSATFRADAARACLAIDSAWRSDGSGAWVDGMLDEGLADDPPPDGLV